MAGDQGELTGEGSGGPVAAAGPSMKPLEEARAKAGKGKVKGKGRPRTNWQLYQRPTILAAALAEWRKTSRKDHAGHEAIRKETVKKIELDTWPEPHSLEKAVYNYFKNHGYPSAKTPELSTTIPDRLTLKSKQLFKRSRAKGASELWASENKDVIKAKTEKGGSGAGGFQAQKRTELFKALPADVQQGYHNQVEHKTEPSAEEEEAAMEQLEPQSTSGRGLTRVGDVMYYVQIALRHGSKLALAHLYVGDTLVTKEGEQGFIDYADLQKEHEQWADFAHKVLPRHLVGEGDGITYREGQPLLPPADEDWSVAKTKEVLNLYFQACWDYAHRDVDDASSLVSPEAINAELGARNWPTPETKAGLFTLWENIRSAEGEDNAFCFEYVEPRSSRAATPDMNGLNNLFGSDSDDEDDSDEEDGDKEDGDEEDGDEEDGDEEVTSVISGEGDGTDATGEGESGVENTGEVGGEHQDDDPDHDDRDDGHDHDHDSHDGRSSSLRPSESASRIEGELDEEPDAQIAVNSGARQTKVLSDKSAKETEKSRQQPAVKIAKVRTTRRKRVDSEAEPEDGSEDEHQAKKHKAGKSDKQGGGVVKKKGSGASKGKKSDEVVPSSRMTTRSTTNTVKARMRTRGGR
ncbi:uncharacterized protein B0H18DRAFT_1126106 [Fomitopsis serialis]|uniref:uncharacterized protein n=1 Tax=Fomitopsis serialis TaxID=139415 RepID=UPI002007598D|nr:uncharacterized protein B0H18DRAFT_1126106 [Neoantrodia serialis]KAH9913614.1 hypothetical protein B0H18DRAFT_1126106 [Neoantrodia serialis]